MRGFFVKNILDCDITAIGLLIERRSIGLKGLTGYCGGLKFEV